MKKLLIFLLLLSLFTFPVFASQVEDFAFQYRNYKTSFQIYDTAKNEYLKHKTLNSQTDAATKTKDFLLQRNRMLSSYLQALHYRLHSTQGVTSEDQQRFTDQINSEVQLIASNLASLEALSTPTLPDLFELSQKIEAKEKSYNLLSYHILNTVGYAKVQTLYLDFTKLNQDLKPSIEKSSISYIKNWHNNSLDTQESVSSDLAIVKATIDEWSTKSIDSRSQEVYSQINSSLEKIRQKLEKGVGYQKEIMVKLEQEHLKK